MANPLASRISPHAALVLDAFGCLAGAVVLLLIPRVWHWIALPDDWRQPVAIALFAFALSLIAASLKPNRVMFALAVLGNIAWIGGGMIALFATDTWSGAILIAVVMLADGLMAWIQAHGLRAK